MTDKTPENHEYQPGNEDHPWIPEPAPMYDEEFTSGAQSEHQLTLPPKPQSLSTQEERNLAMLAHLSILLNMVSGFFGGIAAIIIYFIYKDRSRLVAYHAMQSFIFQTITWIGAGVLAGIFISIGSVFGFLIIPLLCLLPGFVLLLLVPVSLIYGVIGGVKVNNGEDFRYWQVGDWVRYILEPKPISKH